MIYPTLYKKTATGATQIWYMEQDKDKFRTISGQITGKKTTSAWTTAKVTNEGRSNERNPAAQAEFEIKATYKRKLENDYHETIDTIDEGAKIFECMLANKFPDRLKRKQPFTYQNIFSQPKLDGMRCLTNRHGMWTRNGKPIVSCPHIFKALEPAFIKKPNLIFDGELYNHDFKANFNEIMSIFKQLKPKKEDLEKAERFGQYHVYDLTYEQPSDKTFIMRHLELASITQDLKSPYLVLVETFPINHKDTLDSIYEEYLKEGYEGQMIRENTPYENDRTWNLLKRKEFQDIEALCTDIKQGKGNWEGKARIGSFRLENGVEFDADIVGTMEFCEEVFKNREKYLEKKTTIVFQNYTPDGKPRFGKAKEFNRIDI